MAIEVLYENLEGSDLIVGTVYRGGNQGNVSDDPISKLLPVGNQAGFRYCGGVKKGMPKMCVLYSTLNHPDWPDEIDEFSRKFTYFGDNKTFGRSLLDTPRSGNLILKKTYSHLKNGARAEIPPFFVFTKGNSGRDVLFRGVAVPGHQYSDELDYLIIVERSGPVVPLQNFKAVFSLLPDEVIKHEWIQEITVGNKLSRNAPPSWLTWVSG